MITRMITLIITVVGIPMMRAGTADNTINTTIKIIAIRTMITIIKVHMKTIIVIVAIMMLRIMTMTININDRGYKNNVNDNRDYDGNDVNMK